MNSDNESLHRISPIGLRRDTLAEQAAKVLRDWIVSNKLPAGSIHSEVSLANALGISRTPVREALHMLERWDLVRREPGVNGVRILETSGHDVEDILQIRLWLEPEAAAQAVPHLRDDNKGAVGELRAAYHAMLDAGRVDDARRFLRSDRHFHFVILRASGNLRLARYVDGLQELTELRNDPLGALLAEGLTAIAESHEPILKAIEGDGSSRLVARLMREHIAVMIELVARNRQHDVRLD